MSTEVGDSYDDIVELYASINLDALTDDSNARRWLGAFAELAAPHEGTVADLGCGPGHVVDYLSGLGLDVIGYDISPGQIAKARAIFPSLVFHVGNFASLDSEDASLAGIVSRYSIIHVPPSDLRSVFDEWARVLKPDAPVLLSFFGSLTSAAHGTPFDHKVTTAYELFPASIGQQLGETGLEVVEIDAQPASPDSGRPFSQATILSRKLAT